VANGVVDPTLLSFSLNGNAVANINAAIGGGATYFSIGGTLAPAVPEPGSLTLLGLGAFGLFGYAWRRRRLATA
jgi:hypothetical protein